MIPASEFLIPCGDWNGHVGSTGSGYKEVHGGYGYCKPDPDSEGERILEYALAYDLFLGNTCFKKRDSHLITYRSGNTATQIDFMLFRKSLRKLVMDVKVIPGEEVALQHQLLVCDMMIDMPPKSSANSSHVQKCGSSEILKHVSDSRKSSRHMCPLWKLKRLLLLRKSGRNSRQVCWRQQRRCAAQQSPTGGDVKLGGGIRK